MTDVETVPPCRILRAESSAIRSPIFDIPGCGPCRAPGRTRGSRRTDPREALVATAEARSRGAAAGIHPPGTDCGGRPERPRLARHEPSGKGHRAVGVVAVSVGADLIGILLGHRSAADDDFGLLTNAGSAFA